MKKIILKNYITKVGAGFTPKGGKNSYFKKGTSFIRSQNVLNLNFLKESLVFINDEQSSSLSNVEVKENDILMNITGDSIARTCMVPNEILPARVNQHVSIIRCNDKINSKYLLYVLHNLKSYLFKICSVGGTRDALTKDVIENLEIYINDNIIEQEKIGTFLDKIDNRIKINYKINNILNKIIKDIFNYWFLQFNFPISDGNSYKDSGGKFKFSSILKKNIPFNWRVESLSKLIKEDENGEWGEEIESKDFNKKVFCFRGADINGLNGKEEFSPPIRFLGKNNRFSYLKENDLILEISGGSPNQSTGRISYITEKVLKRFQYPVICSNFCRRITLENKFMLYYFFYYWETIYNNNIFFNFEGKTSGIKNLLFELFTNTFKIPIPDNETLERFYTICKDLDQQKQMRIIENQHLINLRDWLIPILINGQAKLI